MTPTPHGSAAATRTPTGCYANTYPGHHLNNVTELELDQIAEELNDRPRKRLGFYKPTNASPTLSR